MIIKMLKRSLILALVTMGAVTAHGQPLRHATPVLAGMDASHFSYADSLIYDAIDRGETPGAVLIVIRDSLVVYRKAYGWMETQPQQVPMAPNTLFDLASLTKPIATATAVMKLLEQGQLRLSDRISVHVPEFERYYGGRVALTDQPRVVDLLTHTANFPFYLPVQQIKRLYGEHTADSVMTWISEIPFRTRPNADFVYSCPSFLALQKVVENITGHDLDTYTRTHIFEPLGMHETMYLPPASLAQRIAPTSYSPGGEVLRGVVHDPVARELMDGISGNAGLFSTADDLAIYAAMMLNGGAINGVRVLSPATVRAMTRLPEHAPENGRLLGWDLSSRFSSNRGDLPGRNTYGHTGYTGTSIIIDPDARTALVLLTNRVYPDDRGNVVDLRAKIANVVAASVVTDPAW